jgi:hypothetical protein
MQLSIRRSTSKVLCLHRLVNPPLVSATDPETTCDDDGRTTARSVQLRRMDAGREAAAAVRQTARVAGSRGDAASRYLPVAIATGSLPAS